MANRSAFYHFVDGKTPLNGDVLNRIFRDVDLRIGTLEDTSVSWDEAIRSVTDIGLERIDIVIGDSINDVNAQLATSSALLTSSQTLLDDITALENNVASQDDLVGFLTSADIANFITVDDVTGAQTVNIPANAMLSRASNGAADGSFETAINLVNVPTKDFDATVTEYVQFWVWMPKSWDAGDITAQLQWRHDVTTVDFDTAFFIQALAFDNDESLEQAFGAAVPFGSDTGGTTNQIYTTAKTAAIAIASTPAKSSLICFQLYRDVADIGDTLAIDASLVGVQLVYQTDAATDA